MKILGDNFFSQQIVPELYANKVNKKVKREFDKVSNFDNYDLPENFIDVLDDLIEKIKEQQERKRGLEDKLKSILMTITIAITAMTFSLSYGNFTIHNILGATTLLFLFISILYFTRSAVFVVKTLVPVVFQNIELDITVNEEEGKIVLKIPTDHDKFNGLLKDKLLNDNVNLRIQNATSASYTLLRNGILVFVLYFLLAITQKVYITSEKHSSNFLKDSSKNQLKVLPARRIESRGEYDNKLGNPRTQNLSIEDRPSKRKGDSITSDEALRPRNKE